MSKLGLSLYLKGEKCIIRKIVFISRPRGKGKTQTFVLSLKEHRKNAFVECFVVIHGWMTRGSCE